jgi:hypothetical protein
MNHPVIPIAVQGASRQRKRRRPRAAASTRRPCRGAGLLGDEPRAGATC